MIYKLKISNGYECHFPGGKRSQAFDALHQILPNSLMLHRYKLVDGQRPPGSRTRQINDPNKIDYSKIKEDSIILRHLDLFEKDDTKFMELVNFCIDNNKDLYVPIYDYNDTFNREENYPWRFNISDNLLFDVDGVETYEFNNENDYKTFISDIKLKSLL